MQRYSSYHFLRSHFKNTMQARGCELLERENAGRKRAQVYPLRYGEHVFSLRRRDLVTQRTIAQGIFEMASSVVVVFLYWIAATEAKAQLLCPGSEQISIGLRSTAPNGANREPVVPPTGDFVVFSSAATNLSSAFVSGASSNSPNIYR